MNLKRANLAKGQEMLTLHCNSLPRLPNQASDLQLGKKAAFTQVQ